MSRLKSLLKSYASQPQYWYKNFTLRRLRAHSDLNILFIVGAPRSGTTLLHSLVATHTDFFTVPYETALFTWQNLFDRKRMGMTKEETISSLDQAKDLVDFLDKYVRGLEEFSDARTFVEKTPQHVNYLGRLMRHFPKAKFIHIYRDVRDCYCSSKSVSSMVSFREPKFFAKYWNKCVRNGLSFRHSGRLHTLSYEALASNAESEMTEIMNFLGTDFEPAQIDPNVFGADPRSKRAHFKRLSTPISAASVGRWERDLSEEEKMIFKQQSGDLLRQLNYGIDGGAGKE